ncbi:hypothetical protein HN011_000065 [Eciton burchellii]|nr:hypothetical protein HN011_000065 [Eciton burchellii]
MTTIHSAAFPETALLKIEMQLSHMSSEYKNDVIKFYIHTEKPFRGVCDISANHLDKNELCTSIAGCMGNRSCLYETTIQALLQHVNENTLTLNFTFVIFHEMLNETMHIMSKSLNQTITKEKQNFLDNSFSSSQVIFKTNDNTYKVSKQLLYATNSCYFTLVCKTYEAGKEDEDITVIIDDMPDSFLTMLMFIKTGTLPQSISYDDAKMLELLILAYRYDVKDLKIICERYLIRNINLANVIKYLDIAIKFEAKVLEEYVMAFIKFHFKELIRIEEFQELSQSYLEKIMKSFQQFEMKKQHAPICTTDILH